MIEYVKLKHLKEGDIIAKSLHLLNHQILIGKGNAITSRALARLQELGYHGVYIENNSFTHRELVQVQKPWLDDVDQLDVIYTLVKLFESKPFAHDPYSDVFPNLLKELSELVHIICAKILKLKETDNLIYELDDMRNSADWVLYHCLNVCLLATAIAVEIDIKWQDLLDFSLGALIHDLGKAKFSREFVSTPNLPQEDLDKLREHPETLFRFMQVHRAPLPTMYAIWQHHEYLDGSGYPKGLTEKNITIWGKILALVNTFDNLTHVTPYADEPMTPSDTLELLYGDQRFDHELVRILASIVAIYPIGSHVLLSNGEKGIVIKNNKQAPLRPMIVVENQLIDMSSTLLDVTVKQVLED